MSSISLLVSGVGAVVAAVGSGVLLARCFRAPRGDLIAWSVALLGLLVSLGSQALGHLSGFDAAMFRAMELGGQVVAPLAVVLGLSEVAAKSMAARFCARLYLAALALVAIVVLALDQLSDTPFTKAWPNPSVYYQTIPNYVLMFAIGPVTALVALIALGTVIKRSGQPGWNAVLPAALLAGIAGLLLAYPALQQLVAYEMGIHLPISSEFSAICLVAAALTWMAGTRTSLIRLDALRNRDVPDQRDFDRFDFDRFDREGRRDQGPYDGLYRDGPGRDHQDYDARDYDRENYDGAGRDRAPADDFDYATGDFAPGEFGGPDGAVNDHDFPAQEEAPAYGSRHAKRDGAADAHDRPAASRNAEDHDRSQLFGQIAIYTLLEDRVAEFDQLSERVVELVRAREPNTLVYIVHAVPSAPMQRILYEVYRDRDAYEWHNRQPHVAQFDADRRPYVLATNVIELGLQQAKVSPFPSVADLFGEPGYDTSGFERPDYLRDYGRTSGQPGPRERQPGGGLR